MVFLPSERWLSLKEKNSLPLGANSFPVEKGFFDARESKQEIIKVVLDKMAEILPSVINPLKVRFMNG